MKAELLVLVVCLLCWTEAEGELLNDNFTKVNDDNRHFNYKQLVYVCIHVIVVTKLKLALVRDTGRGYSIMSFWKSEADKYFIIIKKN